MRFRTTITGSPSPTDGLSREADDQILRSPAGNLTQELAQLLAASIAQNQANKGRGGTPTNAELTSLANLVSAAAAQRTLAPVFKDGLSALSYGQPQARACAHSPPRRISSSATTTSRCRSPPRGASPLRKTTTAGFASRWAPRSVGLIAGLMIVVPAVLWLSGFFSPQKAGPTAAARAPAAIDARASPTPRPPTSRRQSAGASHGPGAPGGEAVRDCRAVRDGKRRAAAAGAGRSQAAASRRRFLSFRRHGSSTPTRRRIEELLTQATQRIESGDVTGAREMLAGADDGAQGAISFALAETYDPNMLAAWGTRGVAADAAKARALYRKASAWA